MIQAITRFVFVATGLLGGYVVTRLADWQAEIGLPDYYVIFLFILLGGSIGFVFGGIVGRELTLVWGHLEKRMMELAAADLVLGTSGLVVGLLVAFLVAQPLRLLEPTWLAISTWTLVSMVASYAGINIALTRRSDLIAAYPQLGPKDALPVQQRSLLLDTSALIDGRFVDLERIGFMPGALRVPRFVLGELQTLADSADESRRNRGRRGLDLLSSLPDGCVVETYEIDYPEMTAVDEKLMRLAIDGFATMVTVDYNLTKVARLRGVEVLNLNEAASALRPAFLPGDVLRIAITKPGKEASQGVGYLEDGTMVVVVDGRDLVGMDARVEVTSVLQTSSGRMIFAKDPGQNSPAIAEAAAQ
jgi:uncharacterized protein YacL